MLRDVNPDLWEELPSMYLSPLWCIFVFAWEISLMHRAFFFLRDIAFDSKHFDFLINYKLWSSWGAKFWGGGVPFIRWEKLAPCSSFMGLLSKGSSAGDRAHWGKGLVTQLVPYLLIHQDAVVPVPLLLHPFFFFFFLLKVVNSSKGSVRAL